MRPRYERRVRSLAACHEEEVITVRRRREQAHKAPGIEKAQVPERTKQADPPRAASKGAKDIAWATAMTIGAHLALDIIRVIREAADLKRSLFPVRDGAAGAVSEKES